MYALEDSLGVDPAKKPHYAAPHSGTLPFVKLPAHGVSCICNLFMYTIFYNSYSLAYPPVRGGSGLSCVQVDKHGITIIKMHK